MKREKCIEHFFKFPSRVQIRTVAEIQKYGSVYFCG